MKNQGPEVDKYVGKLEKYVNAEKQDDIVGNMKQLVKDNRLGANETEAGAGLLKENDKLHELASTIAPAGLRKVADEIEAHSEQPKHLQEDRQKERTLMQSFIDRIKAILGSN